MKKNQINKPNIVLICSDQHNFGVTGCYGDGIIATPNLDRLANEGVVFDAAYCSAPLCVPSRMSFLTGLYPFNNDAIANGSTLASIIPTYAHIAVMTGYHTVLSGRMHFKGPDQRHGFIERLVGETEPLFYWAATHAIFHPLKGKLANMSTPDPLSATGAGNTCYIDYDKTVTGATCSWLDSYGKHKNPRPFLMTVGYVTPHCPYIAPPELYDKYVNQVELEDIPAGEFAQLHPAHKDFIRRAKINAVSHKQRLAAKTAYYGLVDFLDTQIGKVLDSLKKNGMLNNTIVIYFSDHGDLIGEHGRWHKGCFFEGSIRVPLIIKMPDKAHAGKRIKQNVALVDIFPTLCELMNAQVHYKIDGRSLMPLMTRKKPAWDNIVKAEYYEGNCTRMVRKDKWKLNYYSNYGARELFNLEEDSRELKNLSGSRQHKKIEKDLLKLVFNDGWDNNVLKKNDEKLARFGYYEMISKFAQAFGKDSEYYRTAPDFWADVQKCKNWLRK